MTAADELAHENYHDIGRIFSRCVLCAVQLLAVNAIGHSFSS